MRIRFSVLFLFLVALNLGCSSTQKWKCEVANKKRYRESCTRLTAGGFCKVNVLNDQNGLDLLVEYSIFGDKYLQQIKVRPKEDKTIENITVQGKWMLKEDLFLSRCLRWVNDLPENVKKGFAGIYGIQ